MPQLPPDIITAILILLPVMSLLRFRSLSKPFSSQVDGPDFTNPHLARSHRRLILSRLSQCNLYSVDPQSLHPQPIELPNPAQADGSAWDTIAQVKGSCNGLLCLFVSHSKIWLWNPSTRKHLPLQSPPITFPLHYPIHNVVYGFGYDSVRKDYKLLRINHVYSMKSSLWRRVSGFPFRFASSRIGGVFVCGALHFIVDVKGNNTLVIGVDLEDQEEEYRYREVSLPRESLEKVYCDLGVLSERLCFTCCLRDGIVGVWVMKDYGVVESWTMLFSISLNEVSKLYVKPITLTGGGNEVLLIADDKELLSYDLKKDKVEMFKVLGGYSTFEADVYVESLVNPCSNAS